MKNKADNKQTGRLGEDLAYRFLVKSGYSIIEQNYWKKWGEIDIVAKKNEKLHFIEVKCVSCLPAQAGEIMPNVSDLYVKVGEKTDYVSHETTKKDQFRPEDNVHQWKLERLSRTIQTYLLEKQVSGLPAQAGETEWQLDVITVYLDKKRLISRVKILENVII